jgi:hypothetical protein
MGRGGAAACFYHAPGRTQRPGEEDPNQERRLQELSRGYEGSPWLTLLVNFSGFLAIFAGAWAAIFLAGTAGTHGQWWPYALNLAALVGCRPVCWQCGISGGARQPGARGSRASDARSASRPWAPCN